MLRSQAEKKHIQLAFDLNAPAYAYCDVEQITQVLLNLLLNAIQVLQEGGHIRIQVRQTAEHVIDPFFSQREGGIGLGLAVVRQIVLAHHGDISARTSETGGAEFRLQLPLAGTSNT